MKIPLSKKEYEILEQWSKKKGLTVDQGAQLALLVSINKYAPEYMEELEKIVDPVVLQKYEENPL